MITKQYVIQKKKGCHLKLCSDSEKLEKEIEQDPYYKNSDLAFNKSSNEKDVIPD